MQIDVLLRQMVEVLDAPVVGVDHFAGDIAGGRRAVEGHHHVGIVLVGIAFDVLALGSAHEQLAGGVEGLHLDGPGLVHQHAVGNDLRFEARGAKLLGHVFGGFAVGGRGGHVRLGGEGLQLFAGQFGVGDGEEFLFDFGLLAEVGIAEDGLRRGFGGRRGADKKRDKNQDQQISQRLAHSH